MSVPLMQVSGGVFRPSATVARKRQRLARGDRRIHSSQAAGTPPSTASLRALDWLNLLLAALLMGFGPFAGFYLADQGWMPQNIGFVLTASGLAGLLTQLPAGELIDVVRSKRVLVGAGAAAATLALLLLALRPDLSSVFAAALMQGIAGSVIGPGIAAVSLGLVGHDALAGRLGRNQQYASIGGLAAAGTMGVVGSVLPIRDIFLLTAALGLPVVITLARIRASDIHFGRSCGAHDRHATHPQRVNRGALFSDYRLLTFAACLFLFQLANASVLPLVAQTLAHHETHFSSLLLSGFVVIPMMIVAILAPWVGRKAASWGRRPLLLAGLAALPIRSALFALCANPAPLLLVQALDGITGATLGVLTALVIADVTKGTGRFNLAQGFVGTCSGIGAALSTFVSGLVVASYGQAAGFVSATAVGLLALAICWLFMPETKLATPPASAVRG